MSQIYVIKRDGRKKEFDTLKIKNAVLKAFKAVDGEITPYAEEKSEKIVDYIFSKFLEEKRDFTVEEIQDLVEKGLMATKRKDVAKAYVIYRDERSRERKKNDRLTKIISEKIMATNVKNQNANMDEYSFGGRRGEALNEYMKDYALNYCMTEMSKNNHLNNEIYIHDLDSYSVGMHNCLSIPFDDLLKNGFSTRQTDVRSANSINTAFQLIAVIFQLQSLMQFGGVSATHLDWTMVPYVRKSFNKHFLDGLKFLYPEDDIDKNPEGFVPEEVSIDSVDYTYFAKAYKYAMELTERELKQAVEGMYHNLK